jgi:hypothetical protein
MKTFVNICCLVLLLFSFRAESQPIGQIRDSLARISPSQDVVIFVNGFWGKQNFSPSPCPRECYWQFDSIFFKPLGRWNYNQQQCKAFFEEAMVFFNTSKFYFVDGGYFPPTATANRRQRRGRQFIINDLDKIILENNLTDSSTIHFVTHSMGGAFAEGMITALLQKKRFKIGKVLHIATSEAESIETLRNEFGPQQRIQVISQGDNTVEKVNRVHGYKKGNLGKVMPNCDLFACFYENDITRPQAGDIGHALHMRKYIFDIVRDLQNIDIEPVDNLYRLKNASNKVPYRKVKKEGCCVEYDEKKKCFDERN